MGTLIQVTKLMIIYLMFLISYFVVAFSIFELYWFPLFTLLYTKYFLFLLLIFSMNLSLLFFPHVKMEFNQICTLCKMYIVLFIRPYKSYFFSVSTFLEYTVNIKHLPLMLTFFHLDAETNSTMVEITYAFLIEQLKSKKISFFKVIKL